MTPTPVRPPLRSPLPRGPGRIRPRRAPRDLGTLALTLALAGIAVVLAPVALRAAGQPGADDTLMTWWQLAVMFAGTAVFVVHLEFGSEAETFSLSEIPLVLGLFFARPEALLGGRLLGEAVVVLLVRRQRSAKAAFNLCLFASETAIALALFHSLGSDPDPLRPEAWVRALVAAGAASLLGALAVWIVVRLHAGAAKPQRLLLAAAVTVVANTSLAAVAAVLLRAAPLALLPLLTVAGVLVAAYRGYNRLAHRYEGLELLYQFTRITGGPARPEDTVQRVLAEAGRLLRARHAMIALFTPGSDEPWLFLHASTEPCDAGTDAGTGRRPDGDNLPARLRRQVLREGRSLLIRRGASDPEDREVLAGLAAQDCLAAPLTSGEQTSGVFVVTDRLGQVSTFDDEDRRLFATLAAQAAVALENGRLVQRLQEQARVRAHESRHDALTGLPNRTMFSERLRHDLDARGTRRGAVLLMDLDGFKEVNDTLGHHIGDQLLQEVGRRVRDAVGGRGMVARLGGDEFVVLLPDLMDVGAGLALAGEVVLALGRPMQLTAMTLEVGASVGLAVWPDHGTDPTTLLQRADVAMYAAKRTRGGITLYDPDTDWNSQVRLRLAGELRAALEQHQIDVWYQPIARAADGHVVGAEALVRWLHPELGRLSPAEFIPVAERSGLIHDLTLYVLDDALAQVAAWRAGGLELFVTVNLPPQVLRDVDWAAKVADRITRHGVDPRWLTFEITETGIMTDPERMVVVLGDIAASGISFAIDDFGTGYSSLAYLQQLPVSKVKIDKSFVTPMTQDPAAAAIVRSVVDLARSLGLTVVAEGVEDGRTLDQLVAVDCPLVQGYVLSRAIPPADLTTWILQRRATAAAVGAGRVGRAAR